MWFSIFPTSTYPTKRYLKSELKQIWKMCQENKNHTRLDFYKNCLTPRLLRNRQTKSKKVVVSKIVFLHNVLTVWCRRPISSPASHPSVPQFFAEGIYPGDFSFFKTSALGASSKAAPTLYLSPSATRWRSDCQETSAFSVIIVIIHSHDDPPRPHIPNY